MQLETHQMICTERKCLFFHVILFFSLVERKFIPLHGSHLFSSQAWVPKRVLSGASSHGMEGDLDE